MVFQQLFSTLFNPMALLIEAILSMISGWLTGTPT